MKHVIKKIFHPNTLTILLLCFSSVLHCMFLKKPLTPTARLLQEKRNPVAPQGLARKLFGAYLISSVEVQTKDGLIIVDKSVINHSETLRMLLNRKKPGNPLDLSNYVYSKRFLIDTFKLIKEINEKELEDYRLDNIIKIANFLDVFQFNNNIRNVFNNYFASTIQTFSIEQIFESIEDLNKMDKKSLRSLIQEKLKLSLIENQGNKGLSQILEEGKVAKYLPSSSDIISGGSSGLKSYKLNDNKKEFTETSTADNEKGIVYNFDFSQDNKKMAVIAQFPESVQTKFLIASRFFRQLYGIPFPPSELKVLFSPNSEVLVLFQKLNKYIFLWTVDENDPSLKNTIYVQKDIHSVTFNHDSTILGCGTMNGLYLYILDNNTITNPKDPIIFSNILGNCLFHPLSNQLFAKKGTFLVVYDFSNIDSLQNINTMPFQEIVNFNTTDTIDQMIISPNGQFSAILLKQKLFIIHMDSKKILKKFTFPAHTKVKSLSFSQNGHDLIIVYSGNKEHTAIFNILTYQEEELLNNMDKLNIVELVFFNKLIHNKLLKSDIDMFPPYFASLPIPLKKIIEEKLSQEDLYTLKYGIQHKE